MKKQYELKNNKNRVSTTVKRSLLLGLLIVIPHTSNATVEQDVANLDVRVTANEASITNIDSRVTNSENDISALENRVLNQVINANAAIVQLLKSCTDANGDPIDNCFESTLTLTNWITGVRKPNASSPLRVNMGPGKFHNGRNGGSGVINMWCEPENGFTGYTSFVGAGPLLTEISTNTTPIYSSQCTNLSFSGFKITTSYHYILWEGGGKSEWNNMELNTPGGAWSEGVCNVERGQHYWYNSRLLFGSSSVDRGYSAKCDESWFFASELNLAASSNVGPAIYANGAGEIHVYGGNIRALGTLSQDMPMIRAVNNGKVHIHGTGIDVDTPTDQDVIVFKAESGGSIHANSSAYAFNINGTSTITRISEAGGKVSAPYAWGPMADPINIISTTGSDTIVETDCSATVCDDSGSIPHTLLYDTACALKAGSPWRDTQTGNCRGELTD